MALKMCFVPKCQNTSTRNPLKIFITVPRSPDIRRRWFKAVGLEKLSRRHDMHCCEDHFNLEQDATNWIYYKIMGRHIRIRKDVVPHKCLTPLEDSPVESAITADERRQKEKLIEQLYHKTEENTREYQDIEDETGAYSSSLLCTAITEYPVEILNENGFYTTRHVYQDLGEPSFLDAYKPTLLHKSPWWPSIPAYSALPRYLLGTQKYQHCVQTNKQL